MHFLLLRGPRSGIEKVAHEIVVARLRDTHAAQFACGSFALGQEDVAVHVGCLSGVACLHHEFVFFARAFDEDLELESIEFVALAEQLLERYGEQVDFVGWLATMELDEIIALTVGQLVDFVVTAAA